MYKNKNNTLKKILTVTIVASIVLICLQFILKTISKDDIKIMEKDATQALQEVTSAMQDAKANETKADPNEGKYIRLTDLQYLSASNAAWGGIQINHDVNGNRIAVKVEGAYYPFDYGIFAHANSNMYYDISEYSEKYHTLTLDIGINQTSNSGNGVKVWIYTSNSDNFASSGSQNWTLKNEETDLNRVIMPGQNAIHEEVDITGAKFLRIQAYDNGGNGNDHVVYVNPMLIAEGYQEESTVLYDIDTYDKQIKEYRNKDLEDPNYELLVLQRKFVSSVGNYALKRFTQENPENKETVDWLMNDLDNLRYYIMGGTPSGGYYNSLTQLTRLLKSYKSDFNDQTSISDAGIALLEKKGLNWSSTKGELYKRMVITLSLTHSANVGLWMQASGNNMSDAVNRYKIYKDLYNNGQFKATDTVNMTPWFETFHIEEMRWVLGTAIDDEEIIWLNEYTQSRIDATPGSVWGLLTPHPYMAYVWPNYSNPVYYAEENKEYFNDLFAVTKRNEDGTTTKKGLFEYIPYRNGDPKTYKLWMNFRNKFGTGAVCGGISKSGHCIRGVNSIPSAVIGQPGHAALLYYNQNAEGKGLWGIDNNISGWPGSEKGERMPLGWGNDRTYVRGYNVPYIIMAQEALNDYNNLVKAEELIMTTEVYKTEASEQERIYREAINTQSINLDAWAGLVKLYMADTTKTEEQYFSLTKEMMEATKYFPFTMHNLSTYISTKFTSNEYKYKFALLQKSILEEAKNYPNGGTSKIVQPDTTRVLAISLLGQIDTSIATFSFDGADAGKIVLSSKFDGTGIRWDYCIDGHPTEGLSHWKEISFTGEEEHKHQLTDSEIEKITAENDIYIHIVGVRSYNEEDLFKIDIQESAGLPATLYASDLENRVLDVTLNTQWRYTENDDWTKYSESSPDLTGDKTVQLRQGATGTYLASKNPVTFTFTKNTDPDTRKYIPVSHLNIEAVSTEAVNNGGAARYAIDANLNTRWHSAWNGTDTQRYITIKLDKPVFLSAVEFVPAGGGNGRIVKGTVYGSMTGEDNDWVELANNKNAPFSYQTQANTIQQAIQFTKSFEIEEPKKVQYVKIVANQTNGNWFTARAFNFYQDLTKNPHPTAGIGYSTTEKTSEAVIARLINPSTDITITNNDGKDTYVFTENGSFTFKFEDEDGRTGEAIAKVDWIDKKGPDADVNYKLDDDKKLIAILDNISEDVYLLDNNNKKTNYIEVADKKVVSISYLDENEEVYKVSEVDENRVTTRITYNNTTGNVERAKYYVITLDKDKVLTRTGIDEEGNSITLTESEINALRVLEENRSNPLEFYLEANEEYEFKLLDKASNLTTKKVKVDYIDNDTKILVSDITYSETVTTNKDVVATIKPYIIDMNGKNGNAEVVNNNKKATYTFKKNGEFTFDYAETSQVEGLDSEVLSHTAKVDWIDKTAPTAKIQYNTNQENGKVIATLVDESEEIIITNNGGKKDYTFTEDGEFVFEFQDKAGNKGTATATVKMSNDDVKGDINGNGILDIDDLAKLKLHLIGQKVLGNEELEKADMDEDGKITINDIARMKLDLIK